MPAAVPARRAACAPTVVVFVLQASGCLPDRQQRLAALQPQAAPADGSPSAAGAGGGDDSDEDMGYEASMYDESNYIALPTKSEAVNALAPSGTMTGKGTAMAKQVMPNQGRLHVLRVQVWTTFDDPSSSRTAKALSTLVLVVIFTSIINFAIGTSPGRGASTSLGTRATQGVHEGAH